MIEIPPSTESLRLIYIKRGSRALAKLPIIPGLYERLVTTLPNDETSLFAEGILQGLQKEILSLVIQREVYESDIESFLDKKNINAAREALRGYQELESPRDIKARMADEEIRLKSRTASNRESEYISQRFTRLRALLNSKLVSSKESELEQRIQSLTLKKTN